MTQAARFAYEAPTAEAMRAPRVPTFAAPRTDGLVRREPFEDARVRHEARQLGVWVFLVADAVLFSGPFCAYAVLRAARPEVFQYGSYFMSANVGALATAALLGSGLAAVFARRAAASGPRNPLAALLAALLLGLSFVAIVGSDALRHGANGHLPGERFHPVTQVWETPRFAERHPGSAQRAAELAAGFAAPTALDPPSAAARSSGAPAPSLEEPLEQAGVLGDRSLLGTAPSMPPNAHAYFGVYWLLVGLVVAHALAGLGIWSWLLVRASSPHRGALHGSIARASLYWQFVTVVWLFVYPLFYLA